jgi:oligopeptide/dipeptide ABC transporter ATP-binding protein
MALACNPNLLIADEPTTALDVSIQAQILRLMKSLCAERRMAMLYISHDLGVIAQVAQRVAVMYAGQVVEVSPVLGFYRRPLHPYSQGLLRSVSLGGRKERLEPIEGSVPELARKPRGCRFHPRCPRVADLCRTVAPKLRERDEGHWVQCHLYAEDGESGEAAP